MPVNLLTAAISRDVRAVMQPSCSPPVYRPRLSAHQQLWRTAADGCANVSPSSRPTNPETAMSQLVPPHGSRGLRPLQLEGQRLAEESQRAATLRRLHITS